MEIVTYPQKEEIEMSIDKEHLSEMNRLLAHGKTIAEIADEYRQYEYWEIYGQVNDYSFLGKKRKISNNLKRLVDADKQNRRRLVQETQNLLDELYGSLKTNSKKLASIIRVLDIK